MTSDVGHRVPFGVDCYGKVVWPSGVDPFSGYGERCGLRCAECGEPILAVRKSRANPALGISHFSHKSNNCCAGVGEGALHRAAKEMLSSLVGHPFMLPPLSPRDGFAHVSRVSSSGRRVRLPRLVLPDHANCFVPDFSMRGSSAKLMVESVLLEHECDNASPDGIVPDALIKFRNFDRMLAIEMRVSHQKTLEDVEKYERYGLPVIEVYLGDLSFTSGLEERLKERLTGLSPDGTKFAFREWLWSAKAMPFFYANYQPALVCCTDDNKRARGALAWYGPNVIVAIPRNDADGLIGCDGSSADWDDLEELSCRAELIQYEASPDHGFNCLNDCECEIQSGAEAVEPETALDNDCHLESKSEEGGHISFAKFVNRCGGILGRIGDWLFTR